MKKSPMIFAIVIALFIFHKVNIGDKITWTCERKVKQSDNRTATPNYITTIH